MPMLLCTCAMNGPCRGHKRSLGQAVSPVASTACQLSSAGKVAHTQTKIKIKTRGNHTFFFSLLTVLSLLHPSSRSFLCDLTDLDFTRTTTNTLLATTSFECFRAKGTTTRHQPYFHDKQQQQMSKRGTENQLTKDEYDRDGNNDEGSSIQGVFKQASQEEMAKRV